MDGYVATSGTPTQEEQAGKKTETAIMPAVLPTAEIVDHLMSVEGGCQTEEVAKANAVHMINILNLVANEEAKKKHQKPPPTLPKKRDGPDDEEDADLDGGVVEPPPAMVRQIGGSEGSDKKDDATKEKEPTKKEEATKAD